MDTSSFERLPEAIQKIVVDGLDGEVQAGLEHLDNVKKNGSLDPEATAAIEGDVRRAAELRNRYAPAS